MNVIQIQPHEMLYSSTKMFKTKLDDRWVFYAPDYAGMPFVADSFVNQILSAFQQGAIVQYVIDLFSQLTHCSREEIAGCINELLSRGGLKQYDDTGRYKAEGYSVSKQNNRVEIWLHINNHCNLACQYCFVHKDNHFMSHEVIKNTVKKLAHTAKLNQLDEMIVKFAGGEPTLTMGAIESFYHMLKKELSDSTTKLHAGIISNGTVISDRLLHFLKSNQAGISISLDGYGTKGHDIYRIFKNNPQRGSWDLIHKNIGILQKNNIHPFILATISEDSSKTLTELVSWTMKNNFGTRLGIVRTPKGILENTLIKKEEAYEKLCNTMISAFEKVFIELEKTAYPVTIANKIKICELHFEYPSFTTCCDIGNRHIVINEDGNIASCPMTLKEKIVPAEKDILSSVAKTFLHNPSLRNTEEKKNCLDCRWFPVCVSGCPVNNMRNNGNPFSISPLHKFYDYVIPRFVRFYGLKLLQHARLNKQMGYHILSF